MAYLKDVASIEAEISITGKWMGRNALTYHVLGRRSSFTSTSVFNDVGEGLGSTSGVLFPVLTGVESIEVLSSNANDTNTAGTGVRKIRVTYINTSYALIEGAEVNLNGTTPVTVMASGMLQLLWIEAVDWGSGAVAAGTITMRIGGGGATLSQITSGGNKSMDAIFMIPDGYTGYVTHWSIDALANAQDFRLRATCNTYDRTLLNNYIFQDNHNIAGNTNRSEILPWFKFPARCKIKISTISSSTSAQTRADASFSIILIAN